jgi:hypothetical protein
MEMAVAEVEAKNIVVVSRPGVERAGGLASGHKPLADSEAGRVDDAADHVVELGGDAEAWICQLSGLGLPCHSESKQSRPLRRRCPSEESLDGEP